MRLLMTLGLVATLGMFTSCAHHSTDAATGKGACCKKKEAKCCKKSNGDCKDGSCELMKS